MFRDTVKVAAASANSYSLVDTANAIGVEPHAFLSLLFTQLPDATTVEDFETCCRGTQSRPVPRASHHDVETLNVNASGRVLRRSSLEHFRDSAHLFLVSATVATESGASIPRESRIGTYSQSEYLGSLPFYSCKGFRTLETIFCQPRMGD